MVTPSESDALQKQRSNAARTAWKLAIVAMVIFGIFIMSGVIGR
ncbi:MAG: hypothetical protein ACI9CB_000996 [Rhodothermales bacterium]|jgi:hypothetical protein